jgi:hypothetical protein
MLRVLAEEVCGADKVQFGRKPAINASAFGNLLIKGRQR